MPHYLIADVALTDEAWIADYAQNVHDIVHKHGGKYLSRSPNITTLEGDPGDTSVIAIIEFPSLEAAQAFAGDPDYAPYKQARMAGTVSQLRVIDDVDVAGTIPYLPGAERF